MGGYVAQKVRVHYFFIDKSVEEVADDLKRSNLSILREQRTNEGNLVGIVIAGAQMGVWADSVVWGDDAMVAGTLKPRPVSYVEMGCSHRSLTHLMKSLYGKSPFCLNGCYRFL